MPSPLTFYTNNSFTCFYEYFAQEVYTLNFTVDGAYNDSYTTTLSSCKYFYINLINKNI